MEPSPRTAVLVVPGAQRSDVLALAGDRRWEWRVYRSDQSSTTLQEVLQQKPLPVAAVIDASADKPVQLARLIQAGAPLAQIVFVASAEDEARLQGALRTSPLVDAHWVILGRNS